jgi:hypothetical protein
MDEKPSRVTLVATHIAAGNSLTRLLALAVADDLTLVTRAGRADTLTIQSFPGRRYPGRQDGRVAPTIDPHVARRSQRGR